MRMRRVLSTGRRAWAGIKRAMRCAKILARDNRLPKWLRIFAALMFVPIPGPFDEMVALVAFGILFVFYRGVLTEAWQGSAA